MGYKSDYKQDAQDDARHESYLKYLEDHLINLHECCTCEDKFEDNNGVSIMDEKFCNKCFSENKQLEFYRTECGLTDSEIYEFTQNIKQI